MKMWSGRFSQGPNAEFEQWQRSFPFDRVLLPYEVAASKAHAAALATAGVLNHDELATTLFALDQIGREELPAADDPAIEDVHHYVETRLVELAGEVGYKLHTGRSRNEQVATDLRLYVREQIDTVCQLLIDLVGEFVKQAEAAGTNAMPAYTHLQRAEPVLVAHWLLAYVEMFVRDLDRLNDCRGRVNVCPLGSGAVAGTILPLDRAAIAQELGFAVPTANSMDATSDRDFAIEFVQALSLVGLHLSRWAEEFILFSTTEFGLVKLPEEFSTGSSAMPQKKNPDLLELVRGKAARVMGCATTLQTLVKGLPLAYNKDMQETQEPLFNAADTVVSLLPLVTGFMNTVEFNDHEMNQAAQIGFMNAWAAAAYLVERGVPSRQAHEAVGKAVALAIERGCDLQKLPLADLQAIHQSFDAAFHSSLGLAEVLALHDVPGGTAPRHVKRALQNARERVAALRSGGQTTKGAGKATEQPAAR